MIVLENSYIVDDNTSCWTFIAIDKKGVGVIKHQGWLIAAHRHFYLQRVGMVPNEWIVKQTCNNASCVNPNHLYTIEDLSTTIDLVYKGYKFCTVDKCTRKSVSKGMCDTHYRRDKKGLSLTDTPKSSICKHPPCNRNTHTAGYCLPHYRRHKKGQDMDTPIRGSLVSDDGLCNIDGCDINARSGGMCSSHYDKKRRSEARVIAGFTPKVNVCSVEGCDIVHKCDGLCSKHYQRKRHGIQMDREDYGILVTDDGLCSIDGCGKKYYGKGFCQYHYGRDRSGIKVETPYRKQGLPEDRFHSSYTKDTKTGCWLYDNIGDNGYGKIKIGMGHLRAHRYSYELHKGPIPDGMIVRHVCDNPPCVNPNHLELGTTDDNIQDMVNRGRSTKGKTVGNGLLTQDQVLDIYRRTRPGCMESTSIIAKEYSVVPGTISRIKSGKRWAWLTGHSK